MIELLKRWSELQPSEVAPADLKVTLESLRDDLSGVYPQIQWKVQQAIVARGWMLKLFHPMGVERWEALVIWGYFERQECISEANNPAEALLSAYVKALEERNEGC